MKVLFLSLLFAAQGTLLYAQQIEYDPLLKEGKTWNYQVNYRVFDAVGQLVVKSFNYQEWIEGDTIIEGRTYYKMQASTSETAVDYRQCWREEGKKVFFWDDYIKQDVSLYDFGASVGEHVAYMGIDYTVNTTGSFHAQGSDRHYLLLSHGEYDCNHIWVEGVGNEGLLTESLGHTLSNGVDIHLLSCYEDGRCIFSADDFSGIITAIDTPENVTMPATTGLFDLQGRRVSGQLRPGIYIGAGDKCKVMKK